MILGISIIIVIVLLYNMPLKFKVYYEYDGNRNNLEIILQTFYGLIKYDIDIPSLRVKLKAKSGKKNRKGHGYLNNLLINTFTLIIKFDCQDAAVTGIITGILYFIETNLFLFLKSKGIENYRFIIQPLFKQENTIHIKFSCIFQFKIGQIIYERLKFF